MDREDEQVEGDLCLERLADQEVDEPSRLVGRIRAAQHAGELDLPEARLVEDSRGGFGDRRVGEQHLDRRTRAVADDKRLGAVAGAAEALVVSLRPTVDDLYAVVDEVFPVVHPAVVAELRHGRHQERQTGRGRGRVRHDQEVGVFGRRQRREVRWWLNSVLVEPGDVVVDADVAEVDRGRIVPGHKAAQVVGQLVAAAGLVRFEHILVDHP